MKKNNIILIGMPGAGKSTVGVILAKRIGFHFIDTDLIIQAREKCRLQQIIDIQGLEKFRQIEEQMLQKGLEALGKTGILIYIQVSLTALQKRIADMGQRGLVMAKEQTFKHLYQERTPLYEKFANLTIPCGEINAEQVAARIEKEIERLWPMLLPD